MSSGTTLKAPVPKRVLKHQKLKVATSMVSSDSNDSTNTATNMAPEHLIMLESLLPETAEELRNMATDEAYFTAVEALQSG